MAFACPDKGKMKPQCDLIVGQICLKYTRYGTWECQMVFDSAEMHVRGAQRCNFLG